MANRKIKADLEIDGKDNTSAAFRSVATRMGQVEKRIASFNRTAKDFNRTAESFNKRIKDIDKTSQVVGRRQVEFAKTVRGAYATAVRYAAPAVLAYGAKRALTDFAAVNREMNRIGITAGASAAETDAAFSKLQEMAKKTALPIDGAISALDTLVASGLSLKEGMDFLPSVLATAQASGAATTDIANTALKASSALQIQADDMQHAFDIMVTGGKAGQFELKDMAAYLPNLANLFASLGYKGEGGLKRLVAILQTVREDTGNASDAATYAENVFIKMNSRETIGNFKKFGIDLNAEMTKARKNGEDVIDAFVRLSKLAVKGDLTKLPQLFGDQQMLLGMQSLMTSSDSLKKFFDTMNGAEVNGTVWRDLARVTGDSQASIDRLQSSWDKLWNSFGKTVSRPAVPVMDAISNNLDYGEAVNKGLQDKGLSWYGRLDWFSRHAPYGQMSKSDEADDIAYQQGFGDQTWRDEYQKRRYERGVNKSSTGRQNMPVVISEFPGGDRRLNPYKLPLTGVPVPMDRPASVASAAASTVPNVHYWQDAQYQEGQRAMQAALARRTEYYTPAAERTTPQSVPELAGILNNLDDADASSKANYRPYAPETGASKSSPEGSVWSRMDGAISNFFRVPSKDEFRNALSINVPELKQNADDAGRVVADGGKQAGDSIKSGGESAAASILAAAKALVEAADRLNAVQIKAPSAGATVGGVARPQANADTGRSNTFAAAPPGGTGGGVPF